MLGLRSGEVRRMLEAQLLPAGGAFGPVPSGGARRANQDALQPANHGVSVAMRINQCFSHLFPMFLKLRGLLGIYIGIMAKATWEGAVLAESNATVEVEGNQYFPPDAIRNEYFKPSDAHTECPWKGTASYYDVEVKGKGIPARPGTIPSPRRLPSRSKDTWRSGRA